jgi:hypothetical protein
LHQRAEIAITRKEHNMIDLSRQLHSIDGELDIHVSFAFATTFATSVSSFFDLRGSWLRVAANPSEGNILKQKRPQGAASLSLGFLLLNSAGTLLSARRSDVNLKVLLLCGTTSMSVAGPSEA